MRENSNRVSNSEGRKSVLKENGRLCRTLIPRKCICGAPFSTGLVSKILVAMRILRRQVCSQGKSFAVSRYSKSTLRTYPVAHLADTVLYHSRSL